MTSNIRELEARRKGHRLLVDEPAAEPTDRGEGAIRRVRTYDLQLTMGDILQKTSSTSPYAPRTSGEEQTAGARGPGRWPCTSSGLTPHSYPEIGSYFSNRDHSTVMYAVNKIQTQLDKVRPSRATCARSKNCSFEVSSCQSPMVRLGHPVSPEPVSCG